MDVLTEMLIKSEKEPQVEREREEGSGKLGMCMHDYNSSIK